MVVQGMGEAVKEHEVEERQQVLEGVRELEAAERIQVSGAVGMEAVVEEGMEQTVRSGMNCSEREDARTQSIVPAIAVPAGQANSFSYRQTMVP